ncbi:hypothetical protein [Streptomyces collinus]|uniref:hypothetical protein n=1 Tax=Streptomyces collinus TaxID=42684 RepID=UPI00363F085E
MPGTHANGEEDPAAGDAVEREDDAAVERVHDAAVERGDEAERRAAERFVSDLLARGEAVFEGEEPTARTTHVVRREDDGRLTVRRLRFH